MLHNSCNMGTSDLSDMYTLSPQVCTSGKSLVPMLQLLSNADFGYLGTNPRCPGALIFKVILYDEVTLGTSTKCPDYAGVLIFKCQL